MKLKLFYFEKLTCHVSILRKLKLRCKKCYMIVFRKIKCIILRFDQTIASPSYIPQSAVSKNSNKNNIIDSVSLLEIITYQS